MTVCHEAWRPVAGGRDFDTFASSEAHSTVIRMDGPNSAWAACRLLVPCRPSTHRPDCWASATPRTARQRRSGRRWLLQGEWPEGRTGREPFHGHGAHASKVKLCRPGSRCPPPIRCLGHAQRCRTNLGPGVRARPSASFSLGPGPSRTRSARVQSSKSRGRGSRWVILESRPVWCSRQPSGG